MKEYLQDTNLGLENLNDLYNDTMQAVRLGYWQLDIVNNKLFWSPVVYEIHEVDPSEEVDVEKAIKFYHRDFQDLISEALNKAINDGEPWDLELKIVTKTGVPLWVRAIGKAEFENGKAVRLRGLFQDIDWLKTREQELLESQSALKEAEDMAQLGNWKWYVESDKHFWSEGRFKVLGYDADEVAPSFEAAMELVHVEDRSWVEEKVRTAIVNKESYEITYRIITSKGELKVLVDKGDFVESLTYKASYYFGIVRDITKDHLREQKLQESLKSLERSNRELKDFAYVASHDLQEPLRGITSYLQLLEMGYANLFDDEAKMYMDSIINASTRMKKLINDLLTISRLDTANRQAEQVDLNEVLSIVKANLEMSINESGAEISYAELPVVTGDESRMVRLFQNLIGNAIKFRRAGVVPKVEIEWEQVGQKVGFKVSDNGIGIKPDYFDRIFTIFQRLHTREEYEGTGVGLAICKKIVESHGSRIKVESEVGKGSSFLFELDKGK